MNIGENSPNLTKLKCMMMLRKVNEIKRKGGRRAWTQTTNDDKNTKTTSHLISIIVLNLISFHSTLQQLLQKTKKKKGKGKKRKRKQNKKEKLEASIIGNSRQGGRYPS